MTAFLSTWVGVDNEAHVAVTVSGDPATAVRGLVPGLVADRVASRIAAQDPTLWGADAQEESGIRMGWTTLHTSSREFLEELTALRAALQADGITRVVLAGMGGSSLGPEVICATYGVPLVTLDSTDPDQVRDAMGDDLASTVLVVSSKSGGTVETDSARRVFEVAFDAEGLDPRRHIVVVTDPDSPLHQHADASGYRATFLADPHVGGRFSVLSAFGLVPSALAGVPVAELLDEAAAVADSFAEDDDANPALALGAAMAGSTRDKLIISDHGSSLAGFGDWAEQLIAESTGKNGVGILPVVAEPHAPEAQASDVIDTRLVSLEGDDEASGHGISVGGTLGAQFLLWEYATAVAGRILGINPFDQPNVESAKKASRALLDSMPEPEAPAFVDEGIEVLAAGDLLDGVDSVGEALRAAERQLGDRGYIAVMAYLNRGQFPDLKATRRALAARSGRPATFGWGPRFLHSTGQFHKGGPAVGVFVQITGTFADDMDIPGRPFSFGDLIGAQAAGDAQVLADTDQPVLRLRLTDVSQVARVVEILEDSSR